MSQVKNNVIPDDISNDLIHESYTGHPQKWVKNIFENCYHANNNFAVNTQFKDNMPMKKTEGI